jgi:hypothetical protein
MFVAFVYVSFKKMKAVGKNDNLGYGAGAGLSSLAGGSVVISSMGFGGGVVAIVQPIQAPMNRIATKATKTGTAITQNETLAVLLRSPIETSQVG